MDYLEFYGLAEEPFGQAPDNRFYFDSPQHQQVVVRVMHAVRTMKGLAMVVGEMGTGKSMIARKLWAELPEEEYHVSLLVFVHSDLSEVDLLRKLAALVSVPGAERMERREAILEAIYRRLIAWREAGQKVVMLVDEAGILQNEPLRKEFRGLINLEHEGARLVTFVFLGTPELDGWIDADPALRQRVAARCRLGPLEDTSTREYVLHRLAVAGREGMPFTDDACRRIHEVTGGVPRLINTVCDNLLLEGALAKQKEIGPELVDSVAENLHLAAGS